ncbi:MAG: isoleucine--tRNA ligase [Terrimicrobiaceae bacterium]|nr:isoleucine--tRNA ligase [Terrimicrobiaceae bacterium]
MSDYKNTLNLPRTDFPMKAGLTTREPEMLAKWEAAGLYAQIQRRREGAPLFVLHDGPPFANGDVHMGTALNKVLKDFIVKSRTMLGFRAPFIPGWDCHGLPIEFKVVKESAGLSPVEVRKRSEAYARKFIDVQRGQFRRLGVFGDWEHPYLTLDPGYEAEILRSFGRFVEKGLVYRGRKPVLWSTGAQTALAEAEVEYAKRTDPAIYVKFPLTAAPGGLEGASMVIWTTTPWTLPANVAIAVDPRAEYVVGDFGGAKLVVARALLEAFVAETGLALAAELAVLQGAALAGLEAQHPFLPRTSRVITADFVTMETGTGQVHIAPGHGKDDYLAGQQNGLPTLSPVDDHGKFTEECGMPQWVGKYVFDANREIVEFLRAHGALLAAHDYTHDYPHCWRSKTPVVFRAVEQFFIRVDELRAPALRAIDETTWHPHWGRNRIAGTVESRPDWCISRQRTWGVPLPVFYDAAGAPILDRAVIEKVADLAAEHGTNLWFERDDAWWAEALGLPAGTTRRNDTLDVWIDSGVSHEAVLRRRPELAFPADVYVEATDQHRGWFQSSLMTSVALNGCAPYRTVITHGFVVDRDGKKISKSADYKKPMHAGHFVDQYGADILRLWVATVNYTDEVPFGEEVFKQVAERYRGFRNVLRILLANLYDFTPADAPPSGATTIDRWVLSRLQEVIAKCRAAYEACDFRAVFETLNQFCAVDLSAHYIDITKDRLYCDAAGSPRRRATQTVMHACFDTVTRLLAPILVFTADEAWEFAGNAASVHLETFPDAGPRDEALERQVEEWLKLRAAVYQQAVEPARQAKRIAKSLEALVTLQVPAEQIARLEGTVAELEEFFIIGGLRLAPGAEVAATVEKSPHPGCARCWRHLPSVGADAAQPELCDRCAEAVLTCVPA